MVVQYRNIWLKVFRSLGVGEEGNGGRKKENFFKEYQVPKCQWAPRRGLILTEVDQKIAY